MQNNSFMSNKNWTQLARLNMQRMRSGDNSFAHYSLKRCWNVLLHNTVLSNSKHFFSVYCARPNTVPNTAEQSGDIPKWSPGLWEQRKTKQCSLRQVCLFSLKTALVYSVTSLWRNTQSRSFNIRSTLLLFMCVCYTVSVQASNGWILASPAALKAMLSDGGG